MSLVEPVFEFQIELDGDGGRLRQLHEQLRAAILDQRLRAGVELPSTRRVAAAYGLARNTVIAAYDLLVAEGYVRTRGGAKAVVADYRAHGAQPARKTARAAQDRLNPLWRQTPARARNADETWLPGFHLGTPEHREFPFEIWRRLLSRAYHPRHIGAFDYHAPYGRPRLRAAIAQHVSFARAVACAPDDVLVTSGAQQAFDLIARVLVTPGKTRVAVEDPGYPPLRAALLAAGAQLAAVPVDEEGLCVDRLPTDAKLICVTPSHQFPTGVAMSMARRAALLAHARRHGATIVEDDYDGEFRYGPRPLNALQTLDRDASVLYVGTFSKSLFPALRIGYIVAPPWAREALAAAKQCVDTAVNAQLQDALAQFILDGHLVRHVRRMRKRYGERRRAMLDAFAGELRPWLAPIPSEAGIHLSARFRDPDQGGWLLSKARQHAPGSCGIGEFALRPDPGLGLVFGIGGIETQAIRDALHTLALSLRR
ncbi:PLP-dependent aminotransferase family protein [Lysobacter sp. 5GHs7-4]|uniref:MocR-like pyridoxine biosynthesis transcription factor PdxR n=1 Tax=Lysobacter sp. 5GHs7-4 TaxID=2904253 RepID=UPI001E29FC14|nr:PLP-dependent aminotransferase family protein [Lysobacter sp. 5GHs7-4]UHQ22823.1 PLP-dependent aminotransferase family protein [Lysobacter sp. 5GHs7-4]